MLLWGLLQSDSFHPYADDCCMLSRSILMGAFAMLLRVQTRSILKLLLGEFAVLLCVLFIRVVGAFVHVLFFSVISRSILVLLLRVFRFLFEGILFCFERS